MNLSSRFIQNLGAVLPLLMILSWVFSVSMIIKGIVLEKETRLKEVMKVMGMGNGVHWVAWFIDSFIIMFISSCLLVVVLKVSLEQICLGKYGGDHLKTKWCFSWSSVK